MPEKMPPWALLVVISYLLPVPSTWHKSLAKVRCVEGSKHPYPGRWSPGRAEEGVEVQREAPAGPLLLPTNMPGRTGSPTHQLFLRCLLAGLGLRAPELLLSNLEDLTCFWDEEEGAPSEMYQAAVCLSGVCVVSYVYRVYTTLCLSCAYRS